MADFARKLDYTVVITLRVMDFFAAACPELHHAERDDYGGIRHDDEPIVSGTTQV
jgi:hypothetical protein